MKERYWKYSLIVFILGLGYLLFRQAQPFMNGILGGFTLYLLLRNFTFWLQTKMKPALAVWLVTIGVTLFILIPLSLFSWALVSQVSKMHFDTEAIIRPAWHVIDFIKDRTGFDILSEKSLSFFVSQASSIGQSTCWLICAWPLCCCSLCFTRGNPWSTIYPRCYLLKPRIRLKC